MKINKTRKQSSASLLQSALRLLESGIVSVPVILDKDGKKKPIIKWGRFQTETPTEAEVRSWPWERTAFIGIVCRNDLVGLDFDDPAKFEAVRDKLPHSAYIEQTPRGGYHVIFRMKNPPEHGDYENCEVKSLGILISIYKPENFNPSSLPTVDNISSIIVCVIDRATQAAPEQRLIDALLKAGFTHSESNETEMRFNWHDNDRAAALYCKEGKFIVYSPNTPFGKEATQKPFTITEALRVLTVSIVWDAAESQALIARMLLKEPEAFVFVVPELLSKGICGFLYGEGGSFKSLAALWLCIQLAAGEVVKSKWLDRFNICSARRAMFCSIEDPEADIHHRIKSVTERFYRMGGARVFPNIINAEIKKNFHLFPRERWMQDGCEHIVDAEGNPTLKVESIIQYARENSIDLIILDTLSRLSLVDENDNNGGARLVSALERIRDATGATVLVIAHANKVAGVSKTDVHGQNALRGASALMCNARFGLWFQSRESRCEIERLTIHNSKNSRTRRIEPFKVTVDYPGFTLCEEEDTEENLTGAIVADVRAHLGTTQAQTRKRLKRDMKIISQGFIDASESGLIKPLGNKKGWGINE